MRPESKKLLSDMLEAGRSIQSFVQDYSLADFQKSKLVQSAVNYQFAIIGEALGQLRGVDESLAERVSEYIRIIGFRNQLVHAYSKIDPEITWRIIQDKLPILQKEIEELLDAA